MTRRSSHTLARRRWPGPAILRRRLRRRASPQSPSSRLVPLSARKPKTCATSKPSSPRVARRPTARSTPPTTSPCQADAYRTTIGNISQMAVKHSIDLYEAEHGEKPKTYEEFMDVIIKKGKPDGLWLPMLPYYQEYGYDPDKKELVVIEYPAKKKAMQEQSDRELGRK